MTRREKKSKGSENNTMIHDEHKGMKVEKKKGGVRGIREPSILPHVLNIILDVTIIHKSEMQLKETDLD